MLAINQRTYTALDQVSESLYDLKEALTRAKIDKTLRPLETKLETQLAVLFKRQGSTLVRSLTRLRSYFREGIEEDFDTIFDRVTLDTSADMAEAIQKTYEAALLAGGKALIAEFNSSIVFSLTNPRAIAYTQDYAADLITGIDETTKKDIRSIIVAGVQNGNSYTQIASQIKARYKQFAVGVPQKHIRSRAELIAVTEAGNGYQRGNLAAAYAMKESGLLLEKSWRNVGDRRVSQGCKDNTAAGWIALDDAFPSGHDCPLRFPGCRCTSLYRRKPT